MSDDRHDEALDESFPASDPPGNWPAPDGEDKPPGRVPEPEPGADQAAEGARVARDLHDDAA